MPTILTCTDGSPYALSVYEHAAWAAKKLNFPIRVLHMVEASANTNLPDFSGSLGMDAGEELLQELAKVGETTGRLARLKSKAILQDATDRLNKLGITEIETLQRHGAIVDALTEFEPKSGLVVIGKRGEHVDFAKGHLGSNLERVIRTATIPVLIASRAFTPVTRVLVAFDGSTSSLKAIAHIASSALFTDCQIDLIAVTKPDSEIVIAARSAELTLKGANIEATTVILEGKVEEAISRYVTENQVQLLVMGAYGHSRIRQLIIGSTTTELIRTCQVSVLVIR